MRRSVLVMLPAALALSVTLSAAQAPAGPRPVTPEQKRQAVADLVTLMKDRYVLADVAEKAARFLEEKLAKGGYDAARDAKAFADLLTVDLQNVTSDKHLRFGVAPPPEPAPAPGASPKPEDAEAERAAWLAEMRRGNYGFLRAEILPGNVGYLDVRRFQPPDLAGDTLVAVVGFLASADAIIVDVRNCHGGSAYMMPYFNGYFLSRPTSIFDMEFRGDDFTERFWTLSYLPGKRLAEMPMYILTSAYTFSGAEGFAYRFQVLKRATIVGETTGGGANAGGVRDIAPFFRVWLSMGRPVDRDTGGNWEGTGVVPDIKTSAREALVAAHLDALMALRAKASGEKDGARLDWAIERSEARGHPISLGAQDMQRFEGTYGPQRVWVEGDQLRCRRETESPLLLTPVTRNVFAAEALDPVRLEFLAGTGGRIERLAFTGEDGLREEFVRSR